jgi:hypothetical protein
MLDFQHYKDFNFFEDPLNEICFGGDFKTIFR